MTEFMQWLNAQIHLLDEHVGILAADRKLLGSMRHLRKMVTEFPDDPTAFNWIVSRYAVSEALQNTLKALKYRFSVLRTRPFSVAQVQWKLGLYWQCHMLSLSEYMTALNTASERIDILLKGLDQFVIDQAEEQSRLRESDQVIASERLMTSLRPILKHVALSQLNNIRAISFDPDVLIDLPLVRYHPYNFYHILALAMKLVYERRGPVDQLWVRITADDLFMTLAISSPSVMITPAVWAPIERMLNWQRGYLMGRLREFGGFIEPLVWDEGYGQGVIIRLPWA